MGCANCNICNFDIHNSSYIIQPIQDSGNNIINSKEVFHLICYQIRKKNEANIKKTTIDYSDIDSIKNLYSKTLNRTPKMCYCNQLITKECAIIYLHEKNRVMHWECFSIAYNIFLMSKEHVEIEKINWMFPITKNNLKIVRNCIPSHLNGGNKKNDDESADSDNVEDLDDEITEEKIISYIKSGKKRKLIYYNQVLKEKDHTLASFISHKLVSINEEGVFRFFAENNISGKMMLDLGLTRSMILIENPYWQGLCNKNIFSVSCLTDTRINIDFTTMVMAKIPWAEFCKANYNMNELRLLGFNMKAVISGYGIEIKSRVMTDLHITEEDINLF
jgi:hypothetical protein